MSVRLTFSPWALTDLLSIEWAAVRTRASHIPGRGRVEVLAASPTGPYTAKLPGGVRLAGFRTAYDAAQAGLARLEDVRYVEEEP
jgi:hypothetical protein